MIRSDKAIDDTRDIAIRIVDKLWFEGLMKTSFWFDTEFEVQDIIFDELIKMKIMPLRKTELRRFINSLPRENMKWKNKLDDVLYERTVSEHNEYMLDFNKTQKEQNRILYMRRKF